MTKQKSETKPVTCYMCHRKAIANQDVQFVQLGEDSDICLCEDCLQSLMEAMMASKMETASIDFPDGEDEIDEVNYRKTITT